MKNLFEFLKPVIWTICILSGLLVAEKLLGIDMSGITSIGPRGIEFETEAQNSIGELEQKIEQLNIKLEILKEPGSFTKNEFTEMEKKKIEENIEKFQTVPDNIAQFSYVDRDNKRTKFFRQQGYIWIGDYVDSKSIWDKVHLRSLKSKELIIIPPEKIKKGSQFEVTANIILREDKPVNNIKYLKNINRKGIIPSDTKVTVLEEPIKIRIRSISQYWVKVKVEQ